jgi:hypothetical protein
MSRPSGFSPAQRAYLRRLIRSERERLRDEVVEALNEALRSEAQLLFLRDQFPAERPHS